MADAAGYAIQGRDNHAETAAQSHAQAVASTKVHALQDKDRALATQQEYALQTANGKASKIATAWTAGMAEETLKQHHAAAQTMMPLQNTETMAVPAAHALTQQPRQKIATA